MVTDETLWPFEAMRRSSQDRCARVAEAVCPFHCKRLLRFLSLHFWAAVDRAQNGR